MADGPQFPIYIPSKGRADIATTPHVLDSMGVPYRIVVEADQYDDYAANFDPDRLIVLDPAYKDAYDKVWEFPAGTSPGPGAARNFIWDHAVAEGHTWHWVMDDNIQLFARLHRNQRIPVGDGTIFAAMEDFTLRYRNVGMAGPHYWMFATSRSKHPPFITNTRVYSCNLIRNDVPFRWRGRYNEDTILSLDMLKAGWCTIQFFAFLQYKTTTQQMGGGNTAEFYAREGTWPKSKMLVDAHPDVARLVWKWDRWHHHVDYSQFKNLRLIRRDDYEPPAENPYRMRRVERSGPRQRRSELKTP